MRAAAHRVAQARGWRRFALAAAAGAAGALAMPPLGLAPALAVSLTLAVWLLDGAWTAHRTGGVAREAGRAAALGWAWGFGYFVAGLWWLGAAFLVEAEEFAWAMPFGVLGLPALLAVFPALGFALARALWRPGAARLFAFAAALTASEWLRGHLFTGFPWNSPGMALAQALWPLQAASLVGLYGLTLLACLIGAAPALLGTGGSPRGRWLGPAGAALALALLLGYGAWRVPDGSLPPVAGARLRLMQPNLPQDAKFHPANRTAIMRHYLDLSAGAAGSGTADGNGSAGGDGLAGITHLVWPESAFPFLLHRDPEALAWIADRLPEGTTLITGAARMGEPLPGEAAGRFYNAVQVIAHDGTILGAYDKTHLVPFGEYVPAPVAALIRAVGLREFVHIPGGFSPAERRLPLRIPGLPPVAASVCYEAIFPGAVLPEGPRPSLILNVTNDAWFGATPGPYQHFAQARLRAVEEGLPLVRAANTGISAVVDPFGRVVAALPLGVAGVLDAAVPAALPATLYSRYGDRVLCLLLLACLALSLMARPRRQPVPARA